jgi:arsenite methyltransferase
MSEQENVKKQVQEYYGQTLQKSEDLQTNACCTGVTYPQHIKEVFPKIHDEVMSKYYGCGLTIPEQLENAHVLDLGSGSGRDCYLLSSLVGPKGRVYGVDMTDEQLAVANRHREYHRKQFGHQESNVQFIKGDIEKLDSLNLAPKSFDVVISNCVINLATDKEAVLKGVYDLLKVGGEMYFSDVYSDRRIPEELTKDPILYGECLSGALYWNDFLRLARKAGFTDPRLVEVEDITMNNPEVEKKVGDIKFYSATYRLFKLPQLETACEDYGQKVTYKGSLKEAPQTLAFDHRHTFEANKEKSVCGNTFNMLQDSRYAEHFDFSGNTQTHVGIFKECGTKSPLDSARKQKAKTSCC